MDLSDLVKSRLGGFAGHFAIAWAATNWRIPVLLFSSAPSGTERVLLVATELDRHSLCGRLLLVPLFAAVVFAFALLPLSNFLSGISENFVLRARSKAQGFSLLSLEESRKLRDEVTALKEAVHFAAQQYQLSEEQKQRLRDRFAGEGTPTDAELESVAPGFKGKVIVLAALNQSLLEFAGPKMSRGFESRNRRVLWRAD